MIDSVEIGTDTADHSFHQLVSVVASGTSRMMTSSYRRHIVAGSWVCFPSNLNEPEKYLAGAYKRFYNRGQKVFEFCTFLPTERLSSGFGTTKAPSLAHPGLSCLVGIRNVVASAFKSFISKLDSTKTHRTMYLDSCHRAALVALAERSSMVYSCFVNVLTQEQTTSQAPTIHPRF